MDTLTPEARPLPPNLMETDLGIERRCSRCREWWPADGEFWSEKRPGVFYSWCRACFAEYNVERRARLRESERLTGSG